MRTQVAIIGSGPAGLLLGQLLKKYGIDIPAGDAAHIVPPTGAKGLNLPASDVLCVPKNQTRAE